VPRTCRTRLAAALVASLLAACAAVDPGVTAERAERPPVTTSAPPTTGERPPTTAPADGGPIGVGDELFPDLGSPLLDVVHYDVDVTYAPPGPAIEGRVRLTIDALASFGEFTLDAVGLDVSSVSVDGERARFRVDDPELIVEAGRTIARGEQFEVTVDYTATAQDEVVDPGLVAGWFRTPRGSYVLNEPDGARTWLPSNDHPSDKATYTFTVRVPAGLAGVANGELEGRMTDGGEAVWTWEQAEPMATYAIQVLTGPYEIVEGRADAAGVELVSAFAPEDVERMQPYLDLTAEQLDFFDDWFGPYPLDRYGIAMTDGVVGGAMEEQGRSLFSRQDFPGRVDYGQHLLLAHELAHQWFGNSVTPARWKDVWLNESFATYAQWMWLEHAGFETVQESAQFNLEQRQRGSVATGSPSARRLFAYEIYDGGAVVLQALRAEIGDDAFFHVLTRWAHDNEGTSRTSDDFIALASDVAGRDLTGFFDTWLYSADLPSAFPA
jgi:aminopeptidase N